MGRKLRAWWLPVVAATLCASNPALAKAPERTQVVSLKSRVQASYQGWQDASRQVQDLRNTQSVLEHRIAALKRLSSARPLADQGELDTLLKKSVEADRTLSSAMEHVARREVGFRDAVKDAVGAIDREIRGLVPSLKQGTADSRRGAAVRIAELTRTRKEVRSLLSSLAEGRTPQAWARYQVAIDPLDGPSELNEKADFVEDTRDKLKKKYMALARLLREAMQEKEIAQAARDFSLDLSLFDEESRTGRVLRKGRGGGARIATTAETGGRSADDKQEEADLGTDGNLADNEATPAPSPSAGFGGAGEPAAAPPPEEPQNAAIGDPAARTEGTTQDAAPAAEPPAAPPSSPPATLDANPISKEIDPATLLNVAVDDVARGNLDLASLERLVRNLERLDRDLKKQAAEIRAFADQLEEDEEKALGK